MSGDVQQIEPEDEEIAEESERLTDNGVLSVGAWRAADDPDCWVVNSSAQELFRQEPLGVELRQRIQSTYAQSRESLTCRSTTTSNGMSSVLPQALVRLLHERWEIESAFSAPMRNTGEDQAEASTRDYQTVISRHVAREAASQRQQLAKYI